MESHLFQEGNLLRQAAMQPLVMCYTPRIDTFIKQWQVTLDTKQEKLSKCKSIDELMEMSNLPQYNITWGDKNNKEKAVGASCHV